MVNSYVLKQKLRCLIQRGAPKEAIKAAREALVCNNATSAYAALNNYVKRINSNFVLVLVGDHETLEGDLTKCNSEHEINTLGKFFLDIPGMPGFNFKACLAMLNAAVPEFADNGSTSLGALTKYGQHMVKVIDSTQTEIMDNLKACGYGIPATLKGTTITLVAYTSDCDTSNDNLSGKNFSGCNLSNAPLSYKNLTGANLTGANLTDADLSHANLSYANLTGANLFSAKCFDTKLIDASLNGADLSNAWMKYSNLTGATLIDASLNGTNLTAAALNGADLTGADLTGADLTQTDLTDANLDDVTSGGITSDYNVSMPINYKIVNGYIIGSSVNLTDAELSDADLTGAILTGANLTGADCSGCILTGADLTGAIVDATTNLSSVSVDDDTIWDLNCVECPFGFSNDNCTDRCAEPEPEPVPCQSLGWVVGETTYCCYDLTDGVCSANSEDDCPIGSFEPRQCV